MSVTNSTFIRGTQLRPTWELMLLTSSVAPGICINRCRRGTFSDVISCSGKEWNRKQKKPVWSCLLCIFRGYVSTAVGYICWKTSFRHWNTPAKETIRLRGERLMSVCVCKVPAVWVAWGECYSTTATLSTYYIPQTLRPNPSLYLLTSPQPHSLR
jgi:hypothetical protein